MIISSEHEGAVLVKIRWIPQYNSLFNQHSKVCVCRLRKLAIHQYECRRKVFVLDEVGGIAHEVLRVNWQRQIRLHAEVWRMPQTRVTPIGVVEAGSAHCTDKSKHATSQTVTGTNVCDHKAPIGFI